MITDISLLDMFSSICLGSFYGLVVNPVSVSNDQRHWNLSYYILGVGTIGLGIYHAFLNTDKVLDFSDSFLLHLFFAIVSGLSLIIITKRKLYAQKIFETSELDPIVNDFTGKADRKEIKLFGGDLNFFGHSKREMDLNIQYSFLKSLDFKRVLILCEFPASSEEKFRYGKILHDMPNTEFRFYNPAEADLKVRGRIIEVQGVTKLLMYNKIRSKTYETIETDRANEKGELYHNIWGLVWSLANTPTQAELKSYRDLYQ